MGTKNRLGIETFVDGVIINKDNIDHINNQLFTAENQRLDALHDSELAKITIELLLSACESARDKLYYAKCKHDCEGDICPKCEAINLLKTAIQGVRGDK